MSFLKKAIGGFESVVRDVSGNKDYHFGDLTKKALGVPTHSDEEKHTAVNDWIVLKDVASGRTYYQNNRLGVTQWDPLFQACQPTVMIVSRAVICLQAGRPYTTQTAVLIM